MINRGQNYKQVPLNIVGSSTFGRYPKISIEKTYNMFISDDWLIPYAGYKTAIQASQTRFNNGNIGRAVHTSTKLNCLIVVVDNKVYKVVITHLENPNENYVSAITEIGTLHTSSGPVYVAENNKPQIAFSDGQSIYIYDESLSDSFQVATINFTPGYIDFHDTYFLCAASNDTYSSITNPANNTWRLSGQNDGLTWNDDAASIGLLETKPDNTQAVVRFPSKGNLIFVMGETVTEAWVDVGAQLFPYQRYNQFNIDYGCVNPATIAALDGLVVWLAQNEKSGPIILASTGGQPEKITTDGIDNLFSQLIDPADSQAFIYRQDGHLFYHINFYTDNISLFYDFNTQKFFHASDENGNYFIANSVAFYNNQYYFVTKNNGNLYAFDTVYHDYDGKEIPRVRICKNIRSESQDYFIANDVGFTIEQGQFPYQRQETPNGIINELPRVDLSISIDGGRSFGNTFQQTLNAPAHRKNKLMWWQLGLANDLVCQFRFWGLQRFIATDGVVNIRQ